MAIVWRDQMSIDGGLVDEDHKCLIGIANDVEAVRPGSEMSRQVQGILVRLTIYAREHFEREERLQVAVAFPYMLAHHRDHIDLLRELETMGKEYEKALSVPQLAVFQSNLFEFLRHWLVDHICKADMLMRPFVAEMRLHAQGMVPLAKAVQARAAQLPQQQVGR
jgi:hemerythrin